MEAVIVQERLALRNKHEIVCVKGKAGLSIQAIARADKDSNNSVGE
jgi:hypothetical protein